MIGPGRLAIVSLLAIPVLLLLPQIPSCAMAHASREGRVLDANGKGIPSAAVIATANLRCSASSLVESHTATRTEYRIVTHTNDEGQYTVPSNWFRLDLAHLLPWAALQCDQTWNVDAFKLGYVSDLDAQLWARTDIHGLPVAYELSTAKGHTSATWKSLSVEVGSIVLIPRELSLRESAVYYANVLKSGGFVEDQEPTQDELKAKSQGVEYFAGQICALQPSDPIDWVDSLHVFVTHRNIFIRSLKKQEPDVLRLAGESGKPPVFRASSICSALRAAGDSI